MYPEAVQTNEAAALRQATHNPQAATAGLLRGRASIARPPSPDVDEGFTTGVARRLEGLNDLAVSIQASLGACEGRLFGAVSGGDDEASKPAQGGAVGAINSALDDLAARLSDAVDRARRLSHSL